MILIGAFIGLLADLDPYKRYFFAGLAGIFLYTSLCSIFPVINDTLNECRQATVDMQGDLSEADAKSLKNKELLRIFIVNSGFFSALAIMAPLVNLWKTDQNIFQIFTVSHRFYVHSGARELFSFCNH